MQSILKTAATSARVESTLATTAFLVLLSRPTRAGLVSTHLNSDWRPRRGFEGKRPTEVGEIEWIRSGKLRFGSTFFLEVNLVENTGHLGVKSDSVGLRCRKLHQGSVLEEDSCDLKLIDSEEFSIERCSLTDESNQLCGSPTFVTQSA